MVSGGGEDTVRESVALMLCLIAALLSSRINAVSEHCIGSTKTRSEGEK